MHSPFKTNHTSGSAEGGICRGPLCTVSLKPFTLLEEVKAVFVSY